GLHRRVSKDAPYRANRCLAVLSKMLSLSIKWGWRDTNPAKGVERNSEDRRERYLTADELTRLEGALARDSDQQGANIIRLLLVTGSRSAEVRSMRWGDLALKAAIWTKPSAHTKTKKSHRIPLNAPAIELLKQLKAKAAKDAVHVFNGRFAGEPRAE